MFFKFKNSFMIKILAVTFFLISQTSFILAQDMTKKRLFEKEKSPIVRMNFMLPAGFHLFGSLEQMLIPKLTFQLQGGIISALGTGKESDSPELSNVSTVGFFSGELRRYINLYHRSKKGKNISKFSGDYFALKYVYTSVPFARSNQSINFESTTAFQFHYGIQRQIGKKFFVGGNAGFVISDFYRSNPKNSPVGGYPLLQYGMNLGYTF
jgi:hypothetical protein